MNLLFICCIFVHHLIEIWDQVLGFWGFAIDEIWIWVVKFLKSRVLRCRREEEVEIG